MRPRERCPGLTRTSLVREIVRRGADSDHPHRGRAEHRVARRAPSVGSEIELQAIERIGTGQMSQSHRVSVPRRRARTRRPSSSSSPPTTRRAARPASGWARTCARSRSTATSPAGSAVRCRAAISPSTTQPRAGSRSCSRTSSARSQGDQIAGCSVERGAARAGGARADPRARPRRPRARHRRLAEPAQPAQPGAAHAAAARIPRALRRAHRARARRASASASSPSLDAWVADRRPPLGLVHGDYRLDNLLFGDDALHGRRLADGHLGTGDDRRLRTSSAVGSRSRTVARTSSELVALYHGELLAHGVAGLRLGALLGGVPPPDLPRDPDDRRRLDGRRAHRARRRHVHDLARAQRPAGARPRRRSRCCPRRARGRPPALRPEPEDEGRHAPGPEPLWNESWYFDAVSDSGDLGVYVRARSPAERGHVSLHGLRLRARPAVDHARRRRRAAAGGRRRRPERSRSRACDAEQHCEEPLQRFRVTLDGLGPSPRRPVGAAARRAGRAGRDRARPRLGDRRRSRTRGASPRATRFPAGCPARCAIGDEEIAFAGPGPARPLLGRTRLVGRRLDVERAASRGRHAHPRRRRTADARLRGRLRAARRRAVGDRVRHQPPRRSAANGLITSARIVSGPGRARRSTSSRSPSGRSGSRRPTGGCRCFPRAMCRVRTDDGRTGVGWVEWNRVQRREPASAPG